MEQTNVKSLRENVLESIEHHLAQLGDQKPTELYEQVRKQVEPALFESVLRYTKGNKVLAAKLLGISRTTLHTRLKLYFGNTHVGRENSSYTSFEDERY